ncbi:MAG TPA: sigma-70 family RNA polymerase sigma factor [Myxococcota bacterium]|nr:sigma-70 family RNA polymerase sigma factor [Myxococcota bacterium]
MTDALLIADHLAGNPGALETLIARHRGPLMGFLRSRVGEQSAQDLHQELWTRVSRSLERYVDTGRFRAYLFTSARRLVIDHHRRGEARPKLVSLEVERAGRASPASDLAHRELLEAVEIALSELDPPTAEVVRMRLGENLSFKEIAAHQDARLNTVLSRMHRGLRRLRGALSEHSIPLEAG